MIRTPALAQARSPSEVGQPHCGRLHSRLQPTPVQRVANPPRHANLRQGLAAPALDRPSRTRPDRSWRTLATLARWRPSDQSRRYPDVTRQRQGARFFTNAAQRVARWVTALWSPSLTPSTNARSEGRQPAKARQPSPRIGCARARSTVSSDRSWRTLANLGALATLRPSRADALDVTRQRQGARSLHQRRAEVARWVTALWSPSLTPSTNARSEGRQPAKARQPSPRIGCARARSTVENPPR